MKYIVIDQTSTELFNDEFDNLEDAVKFGDTEFLKLTATDKKRRVAFYLLESVNPDEEAADHFDGNVVKEWI